MQTVTAGRLAAAIASLSTNWITELPAPRQLLELVFCSFKKDYGTAMCSCCSNGMHCTDVCQGVDCVNRLQEGESLADECSDNGDPRGRNLFDDALNTS